MKYIKQYDNFKPIKINSAKPFKMKKNIDRSIQHLQKGIKSLRKRLDDPKNRDVNKHSKMNSDKNARIQKLKDLQFKKIKQQEYLRNNPVKESYEENEQNLLTFLESDFEPQDIVNYIGIDKDDYEIKSERWWSEEDMYKRNSLTLLMKESDLEYLLNLEGGIITWFFNVTSYYSSYEYYVDTDELNYLHQYINDEDIKKIEELAEKFKYEHEDINEEGVIYNIFSYLGLKSSLDDFRLEIANEKERATKKCAKDILKSLPFQLDSSRDDKIEIYLEYNDIIEYIKKNKLENDVNTISDFLQHVTEVTDMDTNIEYEGIMNYIDDYKDLNREVENVVEKYLDSPDDIFIHLIEVDNLKAFKDNIEYAIFNYNYELRIDYEKNEGNLFYFAKKFNGEILNWLKSDEFGKYISKNGSKEELEAYETFTFEGNVEKYNF